MIRLVLVMVLLAAPLSALDFSRPTRHEYRWFQPIDKIEDATPRAPEPRAPDSPEGPARRRDEDDRRVLADWFSRGVGIGFVFTGALVYPAAGLGLEVTVPIQREISGLARAGVIGGIFFEGGYYDIGARGYFDISTRFSMYTSAGLRMTYGRILNFAGGELDHPLHRFALGGFAEGGLEFGSKRVRFFAEISINGTRTFDTEFQVGFFCGFNFGIRFYIG